MFFFEKKNQKTFAPFDHDASGCGQPAHKHARQDKDLTGCGSTENFVVRTVI